MTIELKEKLLFDQTKTFLSYYLEKIQSTGLIQPLENFLKNSLNTDLTYTIRSLKNMKIRFPDPVEFLLIYGFENACLDLIIAEILDILNQDYNDNTSQHLSLLVDKKIASTKSKFICEECFHDEFFKLIQRVNIEKAYKVILSQENEDFFIQQFLGVKVVNYKEPSHSKTFQSFKLKISEQSKNININNQNYKITKKDNNIFLISSDKISFLIKFNN